MRDSTDKFFTGHRQKRHDCSKNTILSKIKINPYGLFISVYCKELDNIRNATLHHQPMQEIETSFCENFNPAFTDDDNESILSEEINSQQISQIDDSIRDFELKIILENKHIEDNENYFQMNASIIEYSKRDLQSPTLPAAKRSRTNLQVQPPVIESSTCLTSLREINRKVLYTYSQTKINEDYNHALLEEMANLATGNLLNNDVVEVYTKYAYYLGLDSGNEILTLTPCTMAYCNYQNIEIEIERGAFDQGSDILVGASEKVLSGIIVTPAQDDGHYWTEIILNPLSIIKGQK